MCSSESSNFKTILIGVCGGDFSGKTTVCQNLLDVLGREYNKKIVRITEDIFRKKLAIENGDYSNPEHPDTLDQKLMKETFLNIINKNEIKSSSFNQINISEEELNSLNQAEMVLVEGRFIFFFPEVRELFRVKIFIDVPSDLRLSRRVLSNLEEALQVLSHYSQLVKPIMDTFCLPTKKYADVIIPWDVERKGAISLLHSYIIQTIQARHTIEIDERNRPLYYGS